MDTIHDLLKKLWKWMGNSDSWINLYTSELPTEPFCFPEFDVLQNQCIFKINSSLSREDVKVFLLCLALDNEEERILDACKEEATDEFLTTLISNGIVFPRWEARWQMAELLRRNIPCREYYLSVLLEDDHEYVRKRARNIVSTGEASFQQDSRTGDGLREPY